MINEGKWEASRSWKSGGNAFSSREFQKGRHAVKPSSYPGRSKSDFRATEL